MKELGAFRTAAVIVGLPERLPPGYSGAVRGRIARSLCGETALGAAQMGIYSQALRQKMRILRLRCMILWNRAVL